MTKKDIEILKKRYQVGDFVVIPKEFLPYDNFEGGEDKIGEVVAIYRNFFNVKLADGYERSILFKDVDSISRLVEHIA